MVNIWNLLTQYLTWDIQVKNTKFGNNYETLTQVFHDRKRLMIQAPKFIYGDY